MLRSWFNRISGPDCSLPESEQDIETAPAEASKPSFMARLFDKPVAVAFRRKQDGGGFHAADEQEMEEGGMTSRSSYNGYSGNGGNMQQPAVLWQAGASAWDAAAAGVKGDATAVVNLYRRGAAAIGAASHRRPGTDNGGSATYRRSQSASGAGGGRGFRVSEGVAAAGRCAGG